MTFKSRRSPGEEEKKAAVEGRLRSAHTNNLRGAFWALEQLPNAVARLCSGHAKLLLRKGKDKGKAPNDPLNDTQVLPVLRRGGREEQQRDLERCLCEIIRRWSYLLTFLLAWR